jgi:hypothetical protein
MYLPTDSSHVFFIGIDPTEGYIGVNHSLPLSVYLGNGSQLVASFFPSGGVSFGGSADPGAGVIAASDYGTGISKLDFTVGGAVPGYVGATSTGVYVGSAGSPIHLNGGGVVVGTPTGGSLGVGTVNATAYYQNGTSLGSTYAPLASPTFTGNGTFGGNVTVNGGTATLNGASQGSLSLIGGSQAWSLTSDNASGQLWIYDNTSGNFRFEIIHSTGATLNTSGTWGTISDSRAKTNIQPYTAGLAAVLALDPIVFDYALEEVEGTGIVGFAAEQVQAVMPELTGTALRRLKGEADPIEVLTANPTGVVFALVNALKEMSTQVQELSTRVAFLEGRAAN